jgi:aminoglycoside phosphotransferase (APT) family kinase protein
VPDKPTAEITIDTELIRTLLRTQAQEAVPDAATLPLEKVAEGWDSEVWRLGRALAVRLPRRELAAPLVQNEQLVLPGIARRLRPVGVRVPQPVVAGKPGSGFPWAWSIVPWIEGERGLDVARAERSEWAEALAAALQALHVDAPDGFPVNPLRGRPLGTRDAAVTQRLDALTAAGTLDAASAGALRAAWHAGLTAPEWGRPPVWIHGDLHPGNVVSHDGTLSGIIDFGDVTAGDPAYDLAIAWLAFDVEGRARFVAATGPGYDAATWRRSHAWAAAVALMLLTHSDDNPDYFQLGRDAAAEILAHSPS